MSPMQFDDAKALLEQSARLFAAGEMDSEELGKSAAAYVDAKRRALSALGGHKASPTPGMVFPDYGRAKGCPVAGASVKDLEFYRNGCLRTLGDPEKARFHDKERALLAAIEAELGAR